MHTARRKAWTTRLIVLGIALAVALPILWRKTVRDHFIPRNFGVVQPDHVYRSGRLTPRATRLVHEWHGIKTIIDLGAYDKHPEREEIAQRTAEALGVTRYVFNLEGDGTGNPNAYVAALRVLTNPDNHPVLVHCSAGSERTSACTMLYRKLTTGEQFVDMYPGMMDHRHDPRDNPRLMSFLADHAEAILAAYRAGGNVPGFPAMVEAPRTRPAAPSPEQQQAAKPDAAPPRPAQ